MKDVECCDRWWGLEKGALKGGKIWAKDWRLNMTWRESVVTGVLSGKVSKELRLSQSN